MTDFTPTISDEQAMQIIVRGVEKQVRTDGQRTLDYCKDAIALRGFNVRKLSQRLEARASDKGETFNSDSYQSNVSNANGVIALFDWDLAVFTEWLNSQSTKSLQAIFKAFRELFTEPKAKKAKSAKDEANKADETSEPQALINVVLSALPLLSAEERVPVLEALIALDVVQDEQVVETPVAA